MIGCENKVVVCACEKHTDNQTVLFMIIIIVLSDFQTFLNKKYSYTKTKVVDKRCETTITFIT